MRIAVDAITRWRSSLHARGICCVLLLSVLFLPGVLARSNPSLSTGRQVQRLTLQAGSSSLFQDAQALLRAGRLEEAEAMARRAVAAQPRNTDAHALLGVVLDQRGQTGEAEKEYREALRLDDKSTVALANLGVLLGRTGRVDDAVATFERVLKLQPEHEQATFNLGALYAARKEYVRAIPLLERAANFDKHPATTGDLALLITLANAYAHANRAADAAKLFDQIERGAGDDPPILFTLGLSVADAGDYDRAAKLFNRTDTLRPDTYEEPCQLANCTHVARLRVGCELAQPHVLQHPLTQRGNLSSGIVHGSTPVAIRGGMPRFASYETEPQPSANPRVGGRYN